MYTICVQILIKEIALPGQRSMLGTCHAALFSDTCAPYSVELYNRRIWQCKDFLTPHPLHISLCKCCSQANACSTVTAQSLFSTQAVLYQAEIHSKTSDIERVHRAVEVHMPLVATHKGFHSSQLQITVKGDTFTGQYRHHCTELFMRELVFTCL